MARTTRKKAGKGQVASPIDSKADYNDGLTGQHQAPPPPLELDPSGAAGYASYSSHGGDYGSHDLGSNGDSPTGRGVSPQNSRAYFPAGAPGSGDYSVEDHGNHVQHLPPLSEALHTDDSHHYQHSTGAYEASHHGDTSAHTSYDHSSNNFFDPQIMEPPPPASDGGRHGSIHHVGNGNGHFAGSIMTPPPPSSHGYASSPYQAGHNSAPHMFHRASISGPVMHNHYPPPPGTPTQSVHPSSGGAPPQANDMAAWGTPSGSARPHTADGMFGSQMAGLPQQWANASMAGTGEYELEAFFHLLVSN